jgi:nucleoside permease NupC
VLKALAPQRTRDLVALIFYGLIGGCIVSFMTACIAGLCPF